MLEIGGSADELGDKVCHSNWRLIEWKHHRRLIAPEPQCPFSAPFTAWRRH
jgi:hypothetical protein